MANEDKKRQLLAAAARHKLRTRSSSPKKPGTSAPTEGIRFAARNKAKSLATPSEDQIRKALEESNISTRPKSSPPGSADAGGYYPKNADYKNRQWTRNGKVIGTSESEDAPFVPVNRQRVRGAR